ncbi:MAG TPA: hypothetical protein VG326_04560 [Tepidisphaeraceae bacterium]|jgi:hypothetical protein|nr:hypothetical protein [Tepidisphaeraceae bacterium]
MTHNVAADVDREVTARAGTYYRRARYLICLVVLAAGLWFAYDGLIGYPNEQREFEKLPPQKQSLAMKPKTRLDIRIQCFLALSLIPLSPALLGFFIYRSRGAYRLRGQTLSVPGHPPVPFNRIIAIDMSEWARKGIAYVEYRLGDMKRTRRLTLDDFVYEQDATDVIVGRIEKFITLATTRAADQSEGAEPASAAEE